MSYGSMLHILLLTAKQEPYKKVHLLTKNIEEFSGKSLEGLAGRKRKDRKGNWTRQKNKRGDGKVESNDSPEIPDRGEDIRHPRPPFGGNIEEFSERKKSGECAISRNGARRSSWIRQNKREGKWNQITALRFQRG